MLVVERRLPSAGVGVDEDELMALGGTHAVPEAVGTVDPSRHHLGPEDELVHVVGQEALGSR